MTHTRNKQIRNAFADWKKSSMIELWNAYDHFSTAKERAFEYCEKVMENHNGYGLRIISYNTFCFSVGFLGTRNERPAFFYITRDNDRFIYLDELEG